MGVVGSVPAHEGHEADGLLILEVLGGWVSSREWRLGDWWTVGVLGLNRPYLVIHFRGQRHQSDFVEMLGCQEECSANFDVRMALPMAKIAESLTRECEESGDQSPASSAIDDNTVLIKVRDRRYVQGLLRGDPLVGEARLILDSSAVGRQRIVRLDLLRPECEERAGWLNVQYRVLESQKLQRILSDPSEHSMLAVMGAVADFLRTPDGVERFLDAKPATEGAVSNGAAQRFRAPWDSSRGRARTRLAQVVDSMQSVAESSVGDDGDEEMRARLASVAHEMLAFVAEFAWQDGTGESSDTVALAIKWANQFFATMDSDPDKGVTATPSLSRIKHFFALAPLRAEDMVPVDEKGREISLVSSWNPGMKIPKKAILGEGSYGCVWRAQDRSTKQIFAVKQLFSSSGVESAVSGREVSVAEHLRAVVHPCVVRLVTVLQHQKFNCCSLVMELCSEGDLQGRIDAAIGPDTYTVPELALSWVAEIFLGLEYLHLSIGMLVRDVKPQNIIFARGLHAKITDFGMSRLAATSDGTYSFHPCVPPGSPHYAAPEVILGLGYDYHADLYSLAVLVWVLLTGGIKSSKTAVPPCAPTTRPGRKGLMQLVKNWKLLEAAIRDPGSQGARPLPSEEAKDFVLTLTDRSEQHPWLSHEDVRKHPLLQDADLPPAGNVQAASKWLEHVDGKFCTLEQH